jgi:hypothetical protein
MGMNSEAAHEEGGENATIRTMRYLVESRQIGERIYAYEIAKVIGVEPQRLVRVFKRWSKPENGYLEDCGKNPLPEGLRQGPPPRLYRITAIGMASFKHALEELASR